MNHAVGIVDAIPSRLPAILKPANDVLMVQIGIKSEDIYVNASNPFASIIIIVTPVGQYFGQNSGRPVSDGAIVTKVLVIGAGFFQAMPLG